MSIHGLIGGLELWEFPELVVQSGCLCERVLRLIDGIMVRSGSRNLSFEGRLLLVGIPYLIRYVVVTDYFTPTAASAERGVEGCGRRNSSIGGPVDSIINGWARCRGSKVQHRFATGRATMSRRIDNHMFARSSSTVMMRGGFRVGYDGFAFFRWWAKDIKMGAALVSLLGRVLRHFAGRLHR